MEHSRFDLILFLENAQEVQKHFDTWNDAELERLLTKARRYFSGVHSHYLRPCIAIRFLRVLRVLKTPTQKEIRHAKQLLDKLFTRNYALATLLHKRGRREYWEDFAADFGPIRIQQ